MAGFEFRIRERERCRADGSYGERRDRSDATIESTTVIPGNISISRLYCKNHRRVKLTIGRIGRVQNSGGIQIIRMYYVIK